MTSGLATLQVSNVPVRGRIWQSLEQRFRLYYLGGSGVAVAFYLVFIWRSAFDVGGQTYFSLFDDAMVSMRYAQNLATGQGFVWNPGEMPVEGYSNLLWAFWMAIIHWSGVPLAKTSLVVMLSGAALLIANAWVVKRITETLSGGSALVSACAALSVAFYYPLVFWTLRGTEVGLLALLLSTAILLAIRVSARPSTVDLIVLSLVLAAAVMVRRDAAVPHLIISAYVVWMSKDHVRYVAAATLIMSLAMALAGQTALSVFYYGDLWPNTYYLKLTGASLSERVARGAASFLVVVVRHLYPMLIVALFALAVRWRSVKPDPKLLLAGIFIGQVAYSVYVGGDAWEWMGYANRYLTVGMPALLILAVLSLNELCMVRQKAGTVGMLLLAILFGVTALRALVEYLLLSIERGVDSESLAYFNQHRLLVTTICVALMGLCAAACVEIWRRIRVRQTAARKTSEVGSTSGPNRLRFVVCMTAWLWFLTNIQGVALWGILNGFHVADDALAARVGLSIRDSTQPDAVVAVTWAGAIPYFSQRQTIDILGKNDRVVARMNPVSRFVPGHDKWDLAHSIGTRQPDVAVGLWWPDLQQFPVEDYEPLPATCFVRRSTHKVNREQLARQLLAAMEQKKRDAL